MFKTGKNTSILYIMCSKYTYIALHIKDFWLENEPDAAMQS